MSQENVEVVREAFQAFNRGDLDAALKRMHPDIEWETLDAFPDAGKQCCFTRGGSGVPPGHPGPAAQGSGRG